MNLAMNVCKLGCTKIDIYKFGGYVSRNLNTIEFYNINWKRPERLTPKDPAYSGDLGLDISVNPTDVPLYYNRSKELENASDIVKKMFTLEFHPGREVRNLKREKTMALVKRHESDRGSAESAIAAMTSEIHYIQELLKDHPHDRRTKHFLKELIERRSKFLRHLRHWDYRRFQWVLERMNLVYKPIPNKLGMVSRKNSIRKLTQEFCDKIVQDKLDAYKAELKAKQKDFYREKAEKLAFILKEEIECGVLPSVTEEEIEAAKRKAEELSECT